MHYSIALHTKKLAFTLFEKKWLLWQTQVLYLIYTVYCTPVVSVAGDRKRDPRYSAVDRMTGDLAA